MDILGGPLFSLLYEEFHNIHKILRLIFTPIPEASKFMLIENILIYLTYLLKTLPRRVINI